MSSMGSRENYYIKEGYVHRMDPSHHDDCTDAMNSDAWQKEVYQAAAEYIRVNAPRYVVDLGCGSGYKMRNILCPASASLVVGVEVEPTLSWLKKTYPALHWLSAAEFMHGTIGSNEQHDTRPPDLVVCADVIEHVLYPDLFMERLLERKPKVLYISTPDRSLVREPDHNGPPHNPSHCREHTFAEFRRFMADYLEILDHRVTNKAQGTQLLIGRPKGT
jgi:2-polyprenyl-3-methyl-5-hydroxy-6-metoxy-1,4-benzoquinol methylase